MKIETNMAVQVHSLQEWTAVVRLFQKHGYTWSSDSLLVKEHYFKPGKFLYTREYNGKKFIMHSSTIHTYLNPNPDYHTTLVTLADLFGEEHAILLSF